MHTLLPDFLAAEAKTLKRNNDFIYLQRLSILSIFKEALIRFAPFSLAGKTIHARVTGVETILPLSTGGVESRSL